MLMKCKTCELEFAPPRKNISNCPKCIVFRKVNKPEETIKEASESEQNDDEEGGSDEQNEVEEKQKYRT